MIIVKPGSPSMYQQRPYIMQEKAEKGGSKGRANLGMIDKVNQSMCIDRTKKATIRQNLKGVAKSTKHTHE